MWIKNDVYEILFNRNTWWTRQNGLLINIPSNSGQILCQKGGFSDLIYFLNGKLVGDTNKLCHNNICPEDKLKLLPFFKGIEAYGKKDGSKLSTEDLDIILENFEDMFLNKRSWIKRLYNYLTIEEQE